jgi:uncharacterized membrane protein
MFTTHTLTLLFAALLSGLVAGLLYGYACSVNLGLGKLDDMGYLSAMQSINEAIQNPVFFLCFMGSVVVLPYSTWLCYKNGDNTLWYLMLAATLLYWVGVFGVTIVGNVPLNEALAKFALHSASAEAIQAQRKQFEQSWNTFHFIRTLASIVSFILVLIACLKNKM